MEILTQFAASGGGGNLFGALGIDWKMLILQTISFVGLVWLLAKFVYPIFMKTIDDRQEAIEESAKAAARAESHAKKAEGEIKDLLQEARKQADDIVATAHKEAVAAAADSEEKAKKQAVHIASEARAQIQQDIRDAKKALRQETTELVVLATEKIVRQKVDAKADKALIEAAIKEAK